MKLIVGITLCWLALTSIAQAASFDCSKASTKVETLICRNSSLSDLDLKLNARYKIAIAEGNDSEKLALREQQLKWLQKVRNRCVDAACLQSAYLKRAKEFNWVTKNAENAALCEELRRKNDDRIGLVEFVLDEKHIDQEDANLAIPNVDIDGDKIDEQILIFRPGSASKIAPDNSTFTIRISSSGKQFTKETQGLSVISYRSKYYLLTYDWLTEDGPLQSETYLVMKSGIKKFCSFECGLPSGQCGIR